MNFLANADFNFPLMFIDFFNKHFYVWSYSSGAINFDGTFRFFQRIPNMLVFLISNNVVASYFYILICITICFLAFNWFLKEFFEIKSFYKRLLPVIFFTVNPIFLGNFSKIGLVLGVAMLPLIFVLLKKYFENPKIKYLLIVILLLNISLIHPYIFFVNSFAALIYFLIEIPKNKIFLFQNYKTLLLAIGLMLTFHLYIILPVLQVGSIDKSAILNTVSTQPADYSQLINVANTGTIFTAFSLSKDVLLDFDFYDLTYKGFYFFGIFCFYILLIILYIKNIKSIANKDRLRLYISLSIFLLLLLLSTGTFLNIDKILIFLTQQPGGWIFRSPLKWQLYIPIALYSFLALLIKYSWNTSSKRIIITIFVATLLLTNGYVSVSVLHKLLVPKTIDFFSDVGLDYFKNSRVLLIKDASCNNFIVNNQKYYTELTELLQQSTTQFKIAENGQADSLYLNNFDYLIYCNHDIKYPPNFAKSWERELPEILILKNTISKPIGYIANDVELVEGLPSDYSYVNESSTKAMLFSGILDNQMQVNANLYANNHEISLFKEANINITDNKLLDSISIEPSKDYFLYQTKSDNSFKSKKPLVSSDEDLKEIFNKFEVQNLSEEFVSQISNTNIGDCFNQDNSELINNGISVVYLEDSLTNGIQLEAKKHLGCLKYSIPDFDFNSDYLISFDYSSISGRNPQIGYYSQLFNRETINRKVNLPFEQRDTTYTYQDLLSGSDFFGNLTIIFYVPTDNNITTKYTIDNFKIYEVQHIPKMYLRTDNPAKLTIESEFSYVNPTKYVGLIKNLNEPRLVVFSDTFNKDWKIYVAKDGNDLNWIQTIFLKKPGYQISNQEHIITNGFSNGWWFDPNMLPEEYKNPDGNYKLVIEFWPQRWFYVGLGISGLTLLGCVGYLLVTSKKLQVKRWFKNRK